MNSSLTSRVDDSETSVPFRSPPATVLFTIVELTHDALHMLRLQSCESLKWTGLPLGRLGFSHFEVILAKETPSFGLKNGYFSCPEWDIFFGFHLV